MAACSPARVHMTRAGASVETGDECGERNSSSEGKWGPSQWRLKHSGLPYARTLNITKATEWCHFKQLDATVCQLQHRPAALEHRSNGAPKGSLC